MTLGKVTHFWGSRPRIFTRLRFADDAFLGDIHLAVGNSGTTVSKQSWCKKLRLWSILIKYYANGRCMYSTWKLQNTPSSNFLPSCSNFSLFQKRKVCQRMGFRGVPFLLGHEAADWRGAAHLQHVAATAE